MQLQPPHAKLFERFTQSGTLGEGSRRTDANLADRIDLTSGEDIAAILVDKVDNRGADADPRAGFIRVGKEDLEKAVLGEAEAQIPEFQPTKEQLEEMERELIEAGVFTKEEIEQMLKEKSQPAPAPEPTGEFIQGSVGRDGDRLSFALETVGGETHDFECSLSSPSEVHFMRLTDLGDKFQAVASHLDKKTGQAYRETLTGGWNWFPEGDVAVLPFQRPLNYRLTR